MYMTENTDFQLIKEFLAGDEIAYNKLAVKYRQKIYWHARRMVNNHLDADEITQEVLIVLYNKLNTFKFNSSLYTWIFRITNTRSINLLRKRNLRSFLSLEDNDAIKLRDEADIFTNYESKEEFEKLNDVLVKLPVKQREVFVLRQFEEMSYEEIANVTGKSVGGLKANYFHALKKITELMENED